MIKDFLGINSIEEARVYAKHIIAYADSHDDGIIELNVPIGAGISAQEVNSVIIDALIDSHISPKFDMRTFYGPDGPNVDSRELLITLTRK